MSHEKAPPEQTPPEARSATPTATAPLVGHAVRRGTAKQDALLTELPSQSMAVFLAAVSMVIHAIVAADGAFSKLRVFILVGQLLTMFTAAWCFRRYAVRRRRVLVVSPLLVAGGLIAIAWEFFSRNVLSIGHPFEIVAMSATRNLVMGLAIFSVWPIYQRMSVVLGLFLALFGVTASRDLASQWLAALFAVGAVIWLVTSHWETVQRRLQGSQRQRWPRRAVILPGMLLLAIGVGMAGTDRRVLRTLRGFLPSSGGTGQSSPYARDGVGDGEMLVAGTEQIQTFAPIEDAPFMSDDKPSLYDLLDDSYEEELPLPKHMERAISLPPDLVMRAREHLHTRTEKANREFSTLRKPASREQRRRAKSIHSDALFYVAGRVPLHLRLQVYDLFDGEIWYPADPPKWRPPLNMVQSGGKPWLQLSSSDPSIRSEFLGPAETHALKIVRVDSSVIPAPLFLHGVHIDRVDRVDMFRRGPEGLVAMERDELPSLVPIHLATRPIDWQALHTETGFKRIGVRSATSVIPDSIDLQRLETLANTWVGDATDDWSEVAAIIEQLQRNYTVDDNWRPRPEGLPAIEQFLFESRRGPDYQFATAAALLLRTRGFQTRVVSGFYADPQQYDSSSRHTPILPGDVHFWTEVRVNVSDWVTVEATPGYQVLGPPPGIWQRLGQSLTAAWLFAVRHAVFTVGVVCLLGIGWWKRRYLRGWLATARWWWRSRRSPQDAIAATLMLLRRRSALAGAPANPATTHHRWLGRLLTVTTDSELAKALYQFRRELDAAAYAPAAKVFVTPIDALCAQLARKCTLQWFRELVRETSAGATEQPDGKLIRDPSLARTDPGDRDPSPAMANPAGTPTEIDPVNH